MGYNFAKADFLAIERSLIPAPWGSSFQNLTSLDGQAQFFNSFLGSILATHCPLLHTESISDKPGIPVCLRKLRNKARHAYAMLSQRPLRASSASIIIALCTRIIGVGARNVLRHDAIA